MLDGGREIARDIFLAMLAAAGGDDQAAGDALRRAAGRIGGELFRAPSAFPGASPVAGPGKASMPDKGEPEEEV